MSVRQVIWGVEDLSVGVVWGLRVYDGVCVCAPSVLAQVPFRGMYLKVCVVCGLVYARMLVCVMVCVYWA